MELQAILQALAAAHEAGARSVLIRTDSQYSIDVTTKWIHGWRKRNWVTASGTPVANRSVIEGISSMGELLVVKYEKVKAHSGHEWNERVDDLARRQATAWRDGNGRLAGPGLAP
jgi:ribonuclease HI